MFANFAGRSFSTATLADGNHEAAGELIPVIYQELHRLAAGHLRHERPNHTLQPTALVHEAYIKLVAQRNADWQSRAHFFCCRVYPDAAHSGRLRAPPASGQAWRSAGKTVA